jgi:hypothetical protein
VIGRIIRQLNTYSPPCTKLTSRFNHWLLTPLLSWPLSALITRVCGELPFFLDRARCLPGGQS